MPSVLPGLVVLLASLLAQAEPRPEDRFATEPIRLKVSSPISFSSSWDRAQEEARRTDRRILAVFSGANCGWCRVLEKRTFTDAEVVELSRRYVCVELDTGEPENARLADRYGIDSIPRSLVLTADGRVASKRTGYLPPAEYAAWLRDASTRSPAPTKGEGPAAAAPTPVGDAEAEADVLIWSVDSGTSVERWGDDDWAGHGQLLGVLRAAGAGLRQSASVRPGPAGMPSVAAAAGARRDARREGLTRSSTAFTVPLEKIGRDPSQPREEFDPAQLETLAESLKRDGLLQPITVLWSEEAGLYRIVTGERRYRAARLAGWDAIPCNVLEKPLAPDELLALQCIENLMRADLRPVEQARAFRTLLTVNGWSMTRLAGHMGISQSAVSQSLRLLELPPAVQGKIEAGELSPVAGYHVAKIEDPALQAEVAGRIVAEGLNRDEAVEVVREVKAKAEKARAGGARAKKKPKLVTSRVLRSTNGCRLTVERKKGVDDLVLLEALREVLATLEAQERREGEAA